MTACPPRTRAGREILVHSNVHAKHQQDLPYEGVNGTTKDQTVTPLAEGEGPPSRN